MLSTGIPDGQLQTHQDAGRSPSPTPGGPALHPRPRFTRPRPLLGPPFRRKADQALHHPQTAVKRRLKPQESLGRRQMYCAVALVPVAAFVPPITTAALCRTRRSPPRVLFLECAGSCSCACSLRAPAPRPTIDAGQGPAPRPGVSVAFGFRRMSARPPYRRSSRRPDSPPPPP